jgi:chemotaxis protein histidine kinase CheA
MRNGVRETENRDMLGGTSDTWRGGIPTEGLIAGDTLRIGAVATDSMPPDGQVSEPAERIIHIMSDKDYNSLVMEQIDQYALEKKYGPLLERIAKLESELTEQLAAQKSAEVLGQTPEQRRSALDAIAEKAAALHREVEALRRPEPLFAAEPDLQRALKEHLAALEQAAKEGKPIDPQAQQLQKDMTMMRVRAEHQALLQQLGELAEAQRLAANELADLKQHGLNNDADRARLREASRKQQAMEQALREWQLAAKQVQEQLQTAHPSEASELGDLVQDIQQAQIESLVGQTSRSARASRVDDAHRDGEEAAKRLERFAQRAGQGGKCKNPGWCTGDGYSKCLSQLAGLAKRGYSASESLGGSGGGATGASGGGMMVKRGGRTSPKGQQLQLFGPEALTALPGARGGNQQQGNNGNASADNLEANSRRATAYETDVRKTTAGVGASFSPAEEKLIEEYFRLLDEEVKEKK